MTITNPIVTPTNLSGFPMGLHSYTNITPFTYRDGLSFLEKVEGLQSWLRTILVPHIDGEISEFGLAWNAEVTALQDAVNAALSGQADSVNAAIAAEKEYVDTTIATEKDHVDTTIIDLRTYVDQQIAQIVENSLEANDSVVTALINATSSATRGALDNRYAALADIDTNTASLLADDTATREALDARYFQSSGSNLDVAHGGTGRNTGAIANGIIVAGTTPTDPQQTVSPGTAGQFLKSQGADATPQFVTLIDDTTAATSKVYSSTKTQTLFDALPNTLHGSGLYSARPAASSVKTGSIYYATDVQELYRATGTPNQNATGWAPFGPGGAELGYAQTTTNFQGGGAGEIVDIPGVAITITHGERPVVIEAEAIINGSLTGSVGEVIISIYDGATRIREAHEFTTVANAYATVRTRARISGVAPGTVKTYKMCANRGATVTGEFKVQASATYPAFIQAATL
jgi:hypothetical protein